MPTDSTAPKQIITFLWAPAATALWAERIAALAAPRHLAEHLPARAAPRLLAADSRLRQLMFKNAEPEDLPYVRLSCKLLESGLEGLKAKSKKEREISMEWFNGADAPIPFAMVCAMLDVHPTKLLEAIGDSIGIYCDEVNGLSVLDLGDVSWKSISIDPGLTGCICIFENGELLELHDMLTTENGGGFVKRRVDLPALAGILWGHPEASAAVVEWVTARPNNGAASMFSFGYTLACCMAVLTTIGIQVITFSPQE